MYSSFQLAKKYLHYYFTASNGKGHGMHSPFIFQFILHVLNNKSGYRPPTEIEDLRQQLLKDKTVLQTEDFGAGSRTKATKERTVQQVTASVLKSKKYAQVLFRLVKHYGPKTVLELGTSLGITASYLAVANPEAKVYTLEGSEAIASAAKKIFNELFLQNIESVTGNFDDQLPSVLCSLSSIDLAYIDGNHRYQPTMNYFQQLLSKTHNDSVLVFDDIHWSEEMEKAWDEIKAHEAVRYTVDIFFLGFVFFRKDFKVKQHFKIRF